MTAFVNVRAEDFTGLAHRDTTVIRASLRGTADFAAIASLESVLAQIHEEAIRSPTHEVVVDLKQLEFMNSSCFKMFVTWISEVLDLDEGKQYRIRLVSDPGMHWQKRSLHSLQCFAVDLISIDT